jgi:hypothetical protein
MAHDVLISYSNKDKRVADAVCAALEARGIRCWIAPRDILPGYQYGKAIIRAINGARVLVLIFSSNSNKSQQVIREVERSVSKGLPIIPFRIEDVLPTEDMEFFVSAAHWLDAWTPPLEPHLNQLAESVSSLLDLERHLDEVVPLPVLRLTIHIAQFSGSDTVCCFMNATNLRQDGDVEITHIWIESEPKTFALNRDRPLPKRLRPFETWETWIPLGRIPIDYVDENLYQLGRARISTGEVISSVKNESVPEKGQTPGGPVKDIP